MKPEENILPGMLVWHESGLMFRVVCLRIQCGADPHDGHDPRDGLSGPTETFVLLQPEDDPFLSHGDIPLDEFMTKYHRRSTGWELLGRLDFEERAYEGPVVGYNCIKCMGEVVRIPRRHHEPAGFYQQARAAAFGHLNPNNVAYSEWYEKIEPLSWRLVLDPPI